MKRLLITALLTMLLPTLALARDHDFRNHRERDHHWRNSERRWDHDRARWREHRVSDKHYWRQHRGDPPGWRHGRKTGWRGCALPPGQAERRGCRYVVYRDHGRQRIFDRAIGDWHVRPWPTVRREHHEGD